MEEKLGASPLALEIPIGAEDEFTGVVDLVTKQALSWEDDESGLTYKISGVPDDMAEQVEEWRDKLIETVCETNDELLEKFFEDKDSIQIDEIKKAIREATLKRELVPVLCGSAFRNKGVQPLLDAIAAYLPSPLEVGSVVGQDPRNENEIQREPDPKAPLSAIAFKIATDPFVGRLAFVRVYSGTINAGASIYNMRTQRKERITRIYQMHANKQNPKDQLEAGDIGAVVGFKDIKTGDTLSDDRQKILLESIDFPDPVIGVAVEARSQEEIEKLSDALEKLVDEDPTFRVKEDEESGQTIISGMGELHLEVFIDRLKREFKLEINQGKPQVAYKEAFTSEILHQEIFENEIAGKSMFADIKVEAGPAEKGFKGLDFESELRADKLPKHLVAAVERGFLKAMNSGVLAGYPLVNLKVRLLGAEANHSDSDELALEIAAQKAFKAIGEKAGPVLMEPIMRTEVSTPEEYMGEVIADLNKRRGQVDGMETKLGSRIIRAMVPLAELFGYVTILRSLTSGRAISTREVSHYAVVPRDIAETILKKVFGRTELL